MKKIQILRPLWASFLILILIQACDFPIDTGGDQIRPPQTEILKVVVLPDTVVPGDTAKFACIIKDSLDKKFKFYWQSIYNGQFINEDEYHKPDNSYITYSNSIEWIAPSYKGNVIIQVTVDNGSDSLYVRSLFSIYVNGS